MPYPRTRQPGPVGDKLPRGVQYFEDFSDCLRDAVVIEANGDLRLIRDEETGEELYRFRHELV